MLAVYILELGIKSCIAAIWWTYFAIAADLIAL
jgi:hypothetical protein